jgi:hypothetical protein
MVAREVLATHKSKESEERNKWREWLLLPVFEVLYDCTM